VQYIRSRTKAKIWYHTCGACIPYIPDLIENGVDILNPVQCSARGMSEEILKERHGDRITFWGGGVNTQKTLPFGTPEEVRAEVLRRCEVFSPGGGFVFNTIHNIQALTPVQNVTSMVAALREFNGEI
jgi:uroporphyrinogen-III decarboxylase